MPATPSGEVRDGAPAVVPVIAVTHAGVLGAGLVDPNGAGWAASGVAGVVGCGRAAGVDVVAASTDAAGAGARSSDAVVSPVPDDSLDSDDSLGAGPEGCGTGVPSELLSRRVASNVVVVDAATAVASVGAESLPAATAKVPVDTTADSRSATASVVTVVVILYIVRPPGLIAPPGASY